MRNTEQEKERAVRAAARAIREARHQGAPKRFHAIDALTAHGIEPTEGLIKRAFQYASTHTPRPHRRRPMAAMGFRGRPDFQ